MSLSLFVTPSGPSGGRGLAADAIDYGRRLPAWLFSLLLHAALFFVLVLTLRFSPRGAMAEPDRSVGIVLVRDVNGQREYYQDHQELAAADSMSDAAMDRENVLPNEHDSAADLAGTFPSTDELIGADPGSSLPNAGDLTTGDSPRKALGGRAQTTVFGLAGEGTKFVYVFDRSGSMDGFGGRPLAAAKHELLASLDDLGETHQFQIIFYNERPRIFNPNGEAHPSLVWGDDAGKALARRFVESVVADGGTRHMDALRLGLSMQPDVLFFLTDADEPQLTREELSTIRRLNRYTSINTIEFGFGPRSRHDNFLVQLAHQNGGKHAYFDVSKLHYQR